MALARWSGTVTDAQGNVVENVDVEVRNEDTGLLMQLYADREGTEPLGNPFIAPDGTPFFHVEGGAYQITVSKGAMSKSIRFAPVGTSQEMDNDEIIDLIEYGIASGLGDKLNIDGSNADEDIFKWGMWPVGSYYFWDNVTGIEAPPADHPDFAWVRLEAGLTGGYNNGKLGSENVAGSAPTNTATAVVTLADSPMVGQTIRLLGTEGRYLKPAGAGIGNAAHDQMQQITGRYDGSWDTRATGTYGGAFSRNGNGVSASDRANAGTQSTSDIRFDSADSPGARTGDSTDVKRQNVRVYRCIKNIWS